MYKPYGFPILFLHLNFSLHSSGFKLIILDEADNMTQVAQNALRRSKEKHFNKRNIKFNSQTLPLSLLVIEKYTRNVRFCLVCNYVGKIIPALQSRCTRFRFGPLPSDAVAKRIEYIAECEG